MAELLQLLAPKQETRRGGTFEDVKRPIQQTGLHGVLRFAQLLIGFIAVYCWAKVAEAYQPVTGKFSDIAALIILASTLVLAGYSYVRIRQNNESDLTWTSIIIAALLMVWGAFNRFIAPIIVFTLVQIEHDLAYLLPVIVTAATFAFVPSFQIGRLTFRRELTAQTETNSEKSVIDVTAIELERMKQAADSRQNDIDKAKLREEIDRLTAMIHTPQTDSVIDPEPTFGGKKRIEDCIRAIKVNGHYEYHALARGELRRLDATLLLNFVIEAWGRNQFKRKYWMERGLKRDDWEAMCNAIDFGRNESGIVIRGIDDVIAELMRFGVITPAVYPPAPLENGVSLSRPYGTGTGTADNSPTPGAGG